MLRYKTAKNYLLYLLSRKDYTTQELITKAAQKEYEPEDITNSIQELKEKNFINDARFCENQIYYYSQTKGKGPIWIRQKLSQRKVPSDIIEQEMSKVTFSPTQELKSKILSKYHLTSFDNLEPKTKVKILNYIARQGYSSPYSILQNWQNT